MKNAQDSSLRRKTMPKRKYAWECSCWCQYPNENRKNICILHYDQRKPRPRERKTHCFLNEQTMIKQLPDCLECGNNDWIPYTRNPSLYAQDRIFKCNNCNCFLEVDVK